MIWVFIVLIIAIVAMLLYVFPIIEVCGDSMYPYFNDGDIILGCRIFRISEKSIYIYRPPVGENKYVIKRLTQVSPTTNKLFFEGDNSDYSFDSRNYGYVSQDNVVAKYIFIIHRKGV